MKKILLVEDDMSLAEVIRDYLHFEGYWPIHTPSGDEAVLLFNEHKPSLVLLDVMLPGISGFDVMHKIRESSNVPIVMISAKDDDMNMMKGYELGADDYMSKPFKPKILMAKVNALMNRYMPERAKSKQLKVRDFTFNDEQVKVSFHNDDLLLTPKEYELFKCLALNEGHIFSYENLIKCLDDNESSVTQNAISAHVKNIRKKMERVGGCADCIRTIWGVGYKFDIATED